MTKKTETVTEEEIKSRRSGKGKVLPGGQRVFADFMFDPSREKGKPATKTKAK
jgi:hypothetical protein